MTTTEPLKFRREVSPLELLFDLVFVFAVSQLAHHLHGHLSWRGAAETAVLVVAVFGVWAVVSLGATLLDVTRYPTKYLLVVVMGLGLFMNAGMSHAFSGNAWEFVVPLLVVLFGFYTMTAILAPTDDMRWHYHRGLVWTLTSAPLWLVGAAVAPEPRLWWWAAAATVDLLGVWLAHPLPGRVLRSEHLAFDADHMLERLRLFIILLLGETVLTTGRVISDVPTELSTVLASAGVFVALVCLWATYFAGGEGLVQEHISTTSDPIRSVHLGINAAYGALAALVAVAVGSELVIAHPLGHGSATVGLLLFGGVALFLAAQAWYFRATVRDAWVERAVAVVVVAVAGVGAIWLPPLASLAVLDAILLVVVLTLIRVHKRLGKVA